MYIRISKKFPGFARRQYYMYMKAVILIPPAVSHKFPIIYTVYIRCPDYAGWVSCMSVTLHDSQTLGRATGECPMTLSMPQTHPAQSGLLIYPVYIIGNSCFTAGCFQITAFISIFINKIGRTNIFDHDSREIVEKHQQYL